MPRSTPSFVLELPLRVEPQAEKALAYQYARNLPGKDKHRSKAFQAANKAAGSHMPGDHLDSSIVQKMTT